MSLGALISKSRTGARLSIEDLSKVTNIPGSLLREMENDNFAKCGGETYARGHLRNIASKLGVDERIFLDLFEAEVTAPAKPIRDLLNENNVTMPYQEPKRVSWKILASASVAALIIFGGAQIVLSNNDNSSESEIITTSSATPSETTSETTSQSLTPSATASASVAGTVNVEVAASRGTTWLFASDENGQTLFSGQIRIGNSKIFSQSAQVNLRVGNAGGVDISVNGREVGPIGANGEVVNLTYNAD
jgi:cytoskeletal protein RodZ